MICHPPGCFSKSSLITSKRNEFMISAMTKHVRTSITIKVPDEQLFSCDFIVAPRHITLPACTAIAVRLHGVGDPFVPGKQACRVIPMKQSEMFSFICQHFNLGYMKKKTIMIYDTFFAIKNIK